MGAFERSYHRDDPACDAEVRERADKVLGERQGILMEMVRGGKWTRMLDEVKQTVWPQEDARGDARKNLRDKFSEKCPEATAAAPCDAEVVKLHADFLLFQQKTCSNNEHYGVSCCQCGHLASFSKLLTASGCDTNGQKLREQQLTMRFRFGCLVLTNKCDTRMPPHQMQALFLPPTLDEKLLDNDFTIYRNMIRWCWSGCWDLEGYGQHRREPRIEGCSTCACTALGDFAQPYQLPALAHNAELQELLVAALGELRVVEGDIRQSVMTKYPLTPGGFVVNDNNKAVPVTLDDKCPEVTPKVSEMPQCDSVALEWYINFFGDFFGEKGVNCQSRNHKSMEQCVCGNLGTFGRYFTDRDCNDRKIGARMVMNKQAVISPYAAYRCDPKKTYDITGNPAMLVN